MEADVTEPVREIIDPDIDLVLQAQQELPYRTKAFEQLMKRHEGVLYRVCYRLLGDPDDANDICQEVMVKVFGYLPKFERRSMFKTWLMQIARNTCFTMQAKLKRTRELKEVLEREPTIPKTERIVTEKMDIDSILSKLNKDDREMLVMRYIAELQFDEIAEACGLSLSATKMRIYRATEALKKELTGTDQQ